VRELGAGTLVDGRYTIVKRLGSGGMADVYCAEDGQLGRRVALKVLYARFSEDDEFVERFRREASAAAGLQHQHVVSVYDRGEWEGTSYIAMEFVDGRTLKQVIQAEAPMDPVRAIDIAIQILKAARFAHRRGVIHRDLKPHNVIVEDHTGHGRGPHAKVADFGIARAGASDMTQTGSIMGTAQYLSPEQAQGHAVTPQSDLYSVGICLYEMLTGRVPFDGESAVTIALKQVNEAPVPPSHHNAAVPAVLEDAVLRALAKDPAERFADAEAFIAQLEEARALILAGEAPPAQPTAAFTALAAAPAGAVAPLVVEEEVRVEERSPERGRLAWPWVLLVSLLVVGAILAFLFLQGETSRVPSVVGLDGAAAKVKLERAGLAIDIDQQPNDAPRGTVFNQNPSAGQEVDRGSTVTVLVSSGPGEAQVPDVEGLSRRDARRALDELGFRIREEREPSTAIARGQATRTQPGAGTALQIGLVVTLFISDGPPQRPVPDVVGRPLAEARAALEAAGFAVTTSEQESADTDPGTVLAQSPGGGQEVAEGSSVALTVAAAPADAPVPDVLGETDSDALRILQEAGFDVATRRREVQTPDEDGVVLDQTPAGGRRAAPGETVTIVVGRFNPALDPDPAPTTTPQEPPVP